MPTHKHQHNQHYKIELKLEEIGKWAHDHKMNKTRVENEVSTFCGVEPISQKSHFVMKKLEQRFENLENNDKNL